MLKPITTAPIRANPTKVFLSIFTCLPYYIIILVSYLSIAALINDRNKGCGFNTVLLYSGWNCTPMNHLMSGFNYFH